MTTAKSTPSRKRSPTKPVLKVFFDTNVLFTQVASDLLNKETSAFILANSSFVDLQVQWFLPEVVLFEREYQMQTKAKEIIPAIQKMERLLGHNLAITEQIALERVRTAIGRHLSDHKISTAKLDTSKTDWQSVIHASAFRLPPFSTGDTEKGFRDAIAIETFAQEVDRSPKTPASCRLAFVSKDGLIRSALASRLHDAANVRIFDDLAQLGSLINTLVSEVSEEFINEVAPQATRIFYTPRTDTMQEGLYWEAIKQITERFKNIIDVPQPVGQKLESDVNRLSNPKFLKKEGQTLHWVSEVTVTKKRMRMKIEPPPNGLGIQPPPNLGSINSSTTTSKISEQMNTLWRNTKDLITPQYEEMGRIQNTFGVQWSTKVNHRKQLSGAKLLDIQLDSAAEFPTPDV